MSQERGAYRSITRALLDGPDFQKLPPVARSVFVALKIDFGPAGIEVHYPEALLWQLAHQTGWTCEECDLALADLERAGWIQREGNLVWIVGQLEFEPALSPDNPNHRKAIQNHIAGLPRIAIVGAFIRHYAAWFEGTDSLSDGYPKPSRSPKPKPRQKPKTEIPRTNGAGELANAAEPEEPPFALGPYLDAHLAKFPGSTPPAARYGKAFKALERKHGPAETLRRWKVCLEKKGTFAIPEELASHWSEYGSAGPPPDEEAERKRIAMAVQGRRARSDGDRWWDRMQREANTPNGNELYRYASQHITESADGAEAA